MKILFVNACVRGEASNTLKLCRAALTTLLEKYPEALLVEVDLDSDRPEPLYPEEVAQRSALHAEKAYDHPIYAYAREFAAADKIVIGAPYWDLAFPAVLKIYLERICAVDVTFAYSPEGKPNSLCRADQLLYISTAGGPVEGFNLGFDYIRALSNVFFGIEDVRCFMIPCLDTGIDIPTTIGEGEEQIRTMVEAWA
ncbi:MAG: phosphodiesterase [Firmicutes bacterium]|nr:phosphodiesterase [Bacillota bacterium]